MIKISVFPKRNRSVFITPALLFLLVRLLAASGDMEVIDDPDFPEARSLSAPRGAEREFTTDFSRHTVPYDEIVSGGPEKDDIPSIEQPVFVSADEGGKWLAESEPVLVVRSGDETRVYPLQIMIWHEIVNDTLDGLPIAVTWSPLSNSGVVFTREVSETVLEFGTTGRLRYGNLLMYDRQSESWWQQATGEAVAGLHAGSVLEQRPVLLLSWLDAREQFPGLMVLSRETGHSRPYGKNPYESWDLTGAPTDLYRGPTLPESLPPFGRTLVVSLEGSTKIYPFERLSEGKAVEDTLGGKKIIILWSPGTVSVLDATDIAKGRDVGTANAFRAEIDDDEISLIAKDNRFVEPATGSVFTVAGNAVEGSRAGRYLEPLVAVQHFRFSVYAFFPALRD